MTAVVEPSQVRTALAGAPQAARHELLDDLAGHLAELAAELDAPPLAERLGPPEAYAAELVASTGIGYDVRLTMTWSIKRLSPWSGASDLGLEGGPEAAPSGLTSGDTLNSTTAECSAATARSPPTAPRARGVLLGELFEPAGT